MSRGDKTGESATRLRPCAESTRLVTLGSVDSPHGLDAWGESGGLGLMGLHCDVADRKEGMVSARIDLGPADSIVPDDFPSALSRFVNTRQLMGDAEGEANRL